GGAMAVRRRRAMFVQIGPDLVERAGRDLGAVAQARHQLAVIDHEAAEGGLGGLRGAAEFADFAANLLRGATGGPALMSFEPHGFLCSPRFPSLRDNQGATGGNRQPQTEWAGFMGLRPFVGIVPAGGPGSADLLFAGRTSYCVRRIPSLMGSNPP